LIGFLSKGEATNADRYIETFDKLKEKFRFKRRGRLRSGNVMKLLHDNATPRSAAKTKDWLEVIQLGSTIATSITFLFGPFNGDYAEK